MINSNKLSTYKSLGLACMVALMALHSCAPTQHIREAHSNLPEQFKGQSTDTTTTAAIKWNDFFDDQNLVALIDATLANNQELNIALQRMAMVKTEIKALTGEYLPFVGYGAGAETEKVGEFTRNGAVEKNLEIADGKEFPDPLGNLSLGLTASWELDIWKKLRNAKKAAVFEYLSSVEGKNFLVTQLVAEVANSYYELIALDNQLSIIDQTLENQQNALHMVELQKQAARATELAVRRFQAEVLKNQSHRFEIQQQIVETENKINFLMGRQPQHIDRLSDGFTEISIDPLNAGIPAQLLENRPDIRRAEYELEAAKLDTKSAKANFFPSLGIRAGIGLEAFNTKYLTSTPESLAYSLVGDLVGPLINRNAIKAAYSRANARQLQAVFEYEQAILKGYIEVVNQLSNIDNLKHNFEKKWAQVQALNESIALSTQLFRAARVEYIEVLLAQREALEAKMELVETRKAELAARIGMYQALGGGWN